MKRNGTERANGQTRTNRKRTDSTCIYSRVRREMRHDQRSSECASRSLASLAPLSGLRVWRERSIVGLSRDSLPPLPAWWPMPLPASRQPASPAAPIPPTVAAPLVTRASLVHLLLPSPLFLPRAPKLVVEEDDATPGAPTRLARIFRYCRIETARITYLMLPILLLKYLCDAV